ncbi:hypothetical protein FXO38_23160 [Capsicum annuum]|nr:hypothetical protein FXO38_23160 [Capsicum annuum]
MHCLREEVRGIGHKRKVRDDVPIPENDDDELVKENVRYYVKELPSESPHMFWLYECCSAVDLKIAIKHGSRIPRLLNWETTDRHPHFEAFIEYAPPATGKNKAKKKVDTASSPPYKKQKQVKSSSRNTTRPPISISKASKRSLSPVVKYQTKKVVTQKTVPRRTLPKQPPILEKRKSVFKPLVKPKPSNVPTDIPSSIKSDEESILAKQFIIFQESGHNVEAMEDIPVVSQPSSQRIGTDRSSTPKQGDTCSVELQQCLYVYDSYNSAIHDVYVKTEVQKFAEVIPSSPLNIDFYKKKIDIDWQCHPKYRNRDKSDPFEVIFVNDIPQQRSGSMNCGIYVVLMRSFSLVIKVCQIRNMILRYSAPDMLLCFGIMVTKKESGATSDDEAPAKMHRLVTNWDSSKDVTIL